jgi:teichuronic acid biosynthesis glycosyltransferase TuaC
MTSLLQMDGGQKLRILSFASAFPHVLQKNLGIFVRARLRAMADLAEVKVIAPVAYLEYGNPARHGLGIRKVPRRRMDGALEVFHPRWQYLPNAGPITAFLLAVQVLFRFATLQRRFQYDVIDAHFAFPEGVAAALLSTVVKRPYSITLRGNETEHNELFFRGIAIRWSIRKADRIITVSEPLRKFAIACGADPRRVKTIPNGVDTSVYYPRADRQVLASHGIPADVQIILSAGYLIERKGHHNVIRAMRRLIDGGRTAHLVIAGGPGAEGRFEPTLRKLIAELGLEKNVHFTGLVSPEELAKLMSAAAVLVLASRNEGWPNVVNEGLACGVPVVATDIGGVGEMLPSEEYGFIVPVADQEALETALARALTHCWDRAKIAHWGGARSWEQVATEAVDYLGQLVKKRDTRL